ncbi:MAG: Lrp/AsnC family transcriptional regulator [Chelatococcus sp.]|uniref:Lrp/AsnC family transcriptional regulator n=1 Tax=unclassified Chelatococcus TaxID=2638111 RepID=UPI001BCF10F5|nr:Lrp/AsnC family transcriptional regulator [Chelatococcus sp.]MBS7743170.1 Lrp/AsnC family transcriptional regulator [Chelatococcus sp. HY11]CAH1651442.1 AsnC family transcriptional regulator [Hyphomicrobiales bacterium]MBX3537891.1 Lrp/AsnC family transcriptional regulator [Chelatococcus sp.]MBX3541712.1 Lrp/AsnC family transcriptional regulator [Chelatococcus sp.]MCO5074396.1 Lrp/AsnC family transcriptional regulator [Chelatococcus sp.]
MPGPLDKLDRRIVAALARDGRRTFRDIARELDISEGTVRFRVTRLQEEGLIRVTAVGSPLALGVEVYAMILIRVKPGHVKEAGTILSSYPNVRFVGSAFGSVDLFIQTLHRDTRDLHRFVSEELPQRIPAITSIETCQLAEVLKSTWTWGDWFEYLDGADAVREPLQEAADA